MVTVVGDKGERSKGVQPRTQQPSGQAASSPDGKRRKAKAGGKELELKAEVKVF